MEGRCGTWGSVTTIPSAAGTIPANLILPVHAEDNGIGRRVAGLAIHAKGFHLVKLFVLASEPVGPCAQSFEASSGEGPKCLFGRGDGVRGDGMDEHLQGIRWKGRCGTVNGGMPKLGDGADVGST